MAGLGAGPEFQLMVQTQCALTLACEAHEWAVLNKKFRDLPLLNLILSEMCMDAKHIGIVIGLELY